MLVADQYRSTKAERGHGLNPMVDFINVCHYAGIEDPASLSKRVMEMCALVDEYKEKYKIDKSKKETL